MKILIVNKFLYPNGGSETYIFKVGEQMQRMGHEVQYFGMEHKGRIVGNKAESYTKNIDFHTDRMKRILYPFKIIYSVEARKKIRPVLEQFQPEVVHLNNFNFQLTPSILYEIRKYEKESGNKVKIVYTAHDSQLVCPNHLMQNPITGKCCSQCLETGLCNCIKNRCVHGSVVKSVLGAIEGILYKKLKTYKNIDVIICPSNFIREKLNTDTILKKRTIVMHNFVDGLGIREVQKEDFVLYFGRFSLEKGINTLIRVCKELQDIPFRFAGTGPMKKEIISCKNINVLGFLKEQDLFDVISKAKFTIFPSECYENCPFAVMESLVCGTPVIGSRLGGIPELIKEGINGELFESGNEKELAERIKSLWHEPERLQRYTEACRKEHFDTLQEYCGKLLNVYRGLQMKV